MERKTLVEGQLKRELEKFEADLRRPLTPQERVAFMRGFATGGSNSCQNQLADLKEKFPHLFESTI